MKLIVEFEWDEKEWNWFDIDTLKLCLFTEEFAKREWLKVRERNDKEFDEKWEKEFDELFTAPPLNWFGWKPEGVYVDDVKFFIRQLIQSGKIREEKSD